MDFLTVGALDKLSVVVVLAAVALSIITDKLVWHTRLKAETRRADRWEAIALEALQAGALAGVRAAEVAVDVVSAIPDPSRDRT
jgi:hypothetical protein